MNNKKLLGKRIKEIRKQTGYTQEKLAEIIGVDITTLSGIESGRHFPSLITLEKIAKVLDVALITLFDFSNHVSVNDMKSVIADNLNQLTDDDIKMVYKLINKKYLENV